jgi:iron complex outermembrane receptor protein
MMATLLQPGLTQAQEATLEASGDGLNRMADDQGLQEIIVTAEKQSRSLQQSAAAITALSGDSLLAAGITDIRAAQMLVPAARFQQEGESTQVFLRGVGEALDLANVEPNVAFSFNGVYAPREGTSSALFDVADMEVLPGPQGTLYGRSAVGGTVSVNFNRPSNDWSGTTTVQVGNYDLAQVTVAQNLPLGDRLSVRAAVNYTSRYGYEDSGADSQNDPAERLSLLYMPTADISLYLWTADAQKDGHPPNLVNKGTDPVTGQPSADAFLFGNPWDDLQSRPIPGLASNYAGFGPPTARNQSYDSFANGLQAQWRLGSIILTYLPSYTYLHSAVNYWLGVIPAFISERYDMSSNELRISNDSGGRIDWLLGLSEYHQHNSGYFTVAEVLVNSDIRDNLLEGTAVYGQFTYHASPRWRLTLGGRFSADKREAWGFQSADPLTGAPVNPFTFDQSYSHFDWKTALEYDVAPRVMAYVAAQTGYEPGTYNSAPNTPTFSNAVQPEHLTAYDLGLKSRFLSDTLQLNPELFYYDYRNLIEQQYDADIEFNPIFNAQSVRIYGAQIDLLWKPSRSDELNLSPAYTHARNVRFMTPNGESFDGLQTPYAPDLTVVGGYSHYFPFSSGRLRASLGARYESGWWATYDHNPGTDQVATVKEDASFTFESMRRWSLGIWGKNLSNRAVIAATASGGYPGPSLAYLEAPRTFGLRATLAY